MCSRLELTGIHCFYFDDSHSDQTTIFRNERGETRVSTKAGQGSHGGRTRAAAPHMQVALWADEKAGKGVEKWLETISPSH